MVSRDSQYDLSRRRTSHGEQQIAIADEMVPVQRADVADGSGSVGELCERQTMGKSLLGLRCRVHGRLIYVHGYID